MSKKTSVPVHKLEALCNFIAKLGCKAQINVSTTGVEFLNIFVNGVKSGYMSYDESRFDSFYAQPQVKVLYDLYRASQKEA